MQLTMYQVDAFTDQLFKGNSAAVIELNQWLDDRLMLNIAIENNLSETVFIVRQEDDSYAIRWFSPICEIDFCGHATLASAFILFDQQRATSTLHFFAPAIGKFTVKRGQQGFIDMTFDTQPPQLVTDTPAALLDGLVIPPKEVLRNRQAYFAVYDNADTIRSIKPNLEPLKSLAPYDVVVTAADQQYDFVSRYFWPANGGAEDPVTGSIHCGLAPYWAKQLDKTKLTAFQASARGGLVQCQLNGDKVTISGQAILYMTAIIHI